MLILRTYPKLIRVLRLQSLDGRVTESGLCTLRPSVSDANFALLNNIAGDESASVQMRRFPRENRRLIEYIFDVRKTRRRGFVRDTNRHHAAVASDRVVNSYTIVGGIFALRVRNSKNGKFVFGVGADAILAAIFDLFVVFRPGDASERKRLEWDF